MKVWFKLLISSGIGLVVGFFFPLSPADSPHFLSILSDFVLKAGCYSLFPLVFFSVGVSVQELRQNKQLIPVLVRSVAYMIGITFALVIFGTVLFLLFYPEKIPIRSSLTTDQDIVSLLKNWNETLDAMVPKNAFQILTAGADFLLPFYFFSFVLGLHFNFNKKITSPVVHFFDCLSRIFYHLNSFIVEILGLGLIVLSTVWFIQIRSTQGLENYLQIIVLLSVATGIVLFGFFPLLLYFFGEKENPYKWIFGMMGAGIAAFFSGDNLFCLGITSRLSKENLGIPRKIGAVNLPLFAMFGRSGTAMVSAIAFLVILKSYTSLDITIVQIIWTICWVFLLSFTLSSVSNLGVFITLSLLCGLYGKGYEYGYTNLQPLLPFLTSFSTLLDVYVTSLCSLLIARHTNQHKSVSVKLHI